MTTPNGIRGAIAALITPRLPGGSPDIDAFTNLIRFATARGVSGFAIGGATSEYPRLDFTERERLLEAACETAENGTTAIAAIGAADFDGTLRLAGHAASCGADALLAPPPFFFPYGETDVEAFYHAIARQTSLPILIYNLPSFTTGVSPALAARLVAAQPGIIGAKDSSGRLDMLTALNALTPMPCRLVGNDSVLAEALRLNLCDGCISGIAGVLPELTSNLVAAGLGHDAETLARASALLDELLPRLEALPTPWALQVIAAGRNLAHASFALPAADERRAQIDSLSTWFRPWWQRASALLDGSAVLS